MTSLDGSVLMELLASGIARKAKGYRFSLDVFLDHCIAETRAGKSEGKPAPAFF